MAMMAVLFCLLSATAFGQAGSPCSGKRVIGQESWIHVEELGLDFLARIDTGATTTSLHATDLFIDGGTDDFRDNVGLPVNFLTVATDGQYRRMTTEIAGIQTVANAQGREKRYLVWLTLSVDGVSKKILANLRDRSAMRHKLLIGRDWLAGDFLVDVSGDAAVPIEEGEEEALDRATSFCIPGTPAF